jgi:hypothetical protein
VRVLVGVIVLVCVEVAVFVGVFVRLALVGVCEFVISTVGFEQAVSTNINNTTRIDFFTIGFSPRIFVSIIRILLRRWMEGDRYY